MKQMLLLVVIAMLAGPLFAEEAILIDFSLLKADIHVAVGENDQDTEPNQNRRTMMDFSHVSGNSFTAQQKSVMRTSLAIENWEVVLASSARVQDNISRSFTREAVSKGGNNGSWEEGATVMGVRVHWSLEPHSSWAHVKPPFEIPAFEPMAEISDDGTIGAPDNDGVITPSRFEAPAGDNGKVDITQPAYGVIKNVGVIREVQVNTYGLNFPHSLTTIIIDSQGNSKNMFMGYLNFDGWNNMIWRNPGYVQEVRNRDLRLTPLYPTNTPLVKFGGFILQRDAAKEGGDFVTYFKDVKVIYDKAFIDADRDIDDEALWHIILDRETARKTWEMSRFGQNQVLRYLELQNQATELPFNSPDRAGAGGQER